jgi:hypothetical protein
MYKPYIPVIIRCIYYITITERNHEHLKTRTVQKSNREIVEKESKWLPLTDIYTTAHVLGLIQAPLYKGCSAKLVPYIPVIIRCIYYITITERNHEHLKYEFGIVWMFDNNKVK